MLRMPSKLLPGSHTTLGAFWDGMGVNFAVFSANAQRIDLCIFDSSGRREIARLPLPSYTNEIWHGYLPDARPGLLYGFRAHGPYDPIRGHRFNPAKLLIDPYSRAFHGTLSWSDTLFGYRINSSRSDLSIDRRDSAAAMPKSVVTSEGFNWGNDQRPQTPWDKTVIMEGHVKGLTMRSPDLDPPERGSFQGLSEPRLINHLLRLGITTLELMPVHGFVRDRFLLERGLTNYWGYNSIAFFAPHARYIATGTPDELRQAIRRLHAAGIEVILDVVYNHTAEGSELGPTLCHRGLDNASYYRLVPGDERHHINDTGCGNTLNLSHPRVLQMVLDSLRYWTNSFHIDGFRFDLCATLGRESYGFDPNSTFFGALLQDPLLSTLKLIAEPWDPGPGGYQTGNHPAGFAEWNDRFRDTVRRFWRGDPLQRGDLAARLSGSSDLFGKQGRRPWSSVNFVTAHDGFTLHDVVSYNERHNEANGENGQDGHADNLSNNWGAEGVTEDPDIQATRERVKRGMLATLLFSHGTPMLLAGDEFGQTQEGNNNAYCQDNAISWLDWKRAATQPGRALTAFVSRLTTLRASHPSLRSAVYMHGQSYPLPEFPDISWFDENGTSMTQTSWNDTDGRILAVRRACPQDDGALDITYFILNPASQDAVCTLPSIPPGIWTRLIDSCLPDETETPLGTLTEYTLGAHGVALFAFTPQDESPPD